MSRTTVVLDKKQTKRTKANRNIEGVYKSFDYTDDNLSLVSQGIRHQPTKIKNLIKIGCEN